MAVTVVHATHTGHVLAAIDMSGPSGPPPSLAELVGPALPVRLSRTPEPDGGELQPPRVLVAAEHLATAAAEQVAGLLNRPMTFGVGPGRTPTPLSPWAAGKPVELRTDGVHVTLDRTSTGQPTKVLVVLAGPGRALAPGDEVPEVTVFGQVFTGRKVTTLGAALDKGCWYTVLTLAEGWHGRLEALEVT